MPVDTEDAVSGELRDLPCDADPVSVLALNNDAVVWCTVSRDLVVWSRHADDPQVLMRLPYSPHSIALTDGGLLVLVTPTGVFAYTLRLNPDGAFRIDEHAIIRDVDRAISMAYATDITVAQDESAVALATPTQLLLVALAPADSSDKNGAIGVSCRAWFGQQNDGCALVCFASPTRLLVCSEEGHLVSLRFDVETMSCARERDGHVLAKGGDRITCLAASYAHDNLLLVGTSNGLLEVLQLDTLASARTLNVRHMLQRLATPDAPMTAPFNAARPWRTERTAADGDANSFADCATLSAAVGSSLLAVLTTDAVMYIHKAPLVVNQDESFFLEPNERLESGLGLVALTARNGCWCAWQPATLSFRYFVAAASPAVNAWGRHNANEGSSDATEDDVIHARVPLPSAWLAPLSDCTAQPTPPIAGRGKSKVPPPQSVDRPVTFGHKVRSSGYREAVPWSEQQKQKKRTQARRDQARQSRQFGAADATAPSAERYAAVQCYADHPLQSVARMNTLMATKAVLHQGTILGATFAASGSVLLTCSSDNSAYQLRFPLPKKDVEGSGLRGHTAAVLSIEANLALKAPLTVTSSADGTIALWKATVKEAPIARYSPAPARGESKADLRAARFFYLDKLLCFISGRQCAISPYTLETREEKDGLMRVATPARVADPVFTFTMPDAQAITAMACVNHFLSPLVVLAASNKALCLLDVAAQAPMRVIPEAHSRAIHSVAMCTNSRFARAGGLCGSAAEHTLLTAGLDGVVNMWDVRQSTRAGQFALHKNTALPTIGLALSPTGQQFAVGSEDRSVYLYDTRTAMTALDVIPTRNVPSALAWHPTDPVLAVGDTAGQITFFAQR